MFVGDTPDALNPTVAVTTMLSTYELFSQIVMTPAMSNTNAPVFGAASPFMVPGAVNFVAPGTVAYSVADPLSRTVALPQVGWVASTGISRFALCDAE